MVPAIEEIPKLVLSCCKGNWSGVDSKRILSHIIFLSYVTTYLQENP